MKCKTNRKTFLCEAGRITINNNAQKITSDWLEDDDDAHFLRPETERAPPPLNARPKHVARTLIANCRRRFRRNLLNIMSNATNNLANNVTLFGDVKKLQLSWREILLQYFQQILRS